MYATYANIQIYLIIQPSTWLSRLPLTFYSTGSSLLLLLSASLLRLPRTAAAANESGAIRGVTFHTSPSTNQEAEREEARRKVNKRSQ